jgi:hypothetical protein
MLARRVLPSFSSPAFHLPAPEPVLLYPIRSEKTVLRVREMILQIKFNEFLAALTKGLAEWQRILQ